MARSKRGRNGKQPRSTNKTEYRDNHRQGNYASNRDDNKSDISQEKSSVEPDADIKTKGTTANDPAWYARDPALLQAASNVPFSEPLGSDFGLHKITGNEYFNILSNPGARSIPGICALTVKPSIGYNVDRNSPINVAAQAFYTHVRYVNSGRKNYDQADLMMYALAISDIYSYVMYMQRIYALAFMYSQRNYFVGKNLLEAMDVDADSIISNLANFRYKLNAFINKISTFAVPADIALFNRRAFMYAGLYTESPDGFVKDQIYLFKPWGFYKYRLDDGGKGMLEFVKMQHYAANTPRTADVLFSIGEDLLSNIYGDEDFGLMAGDIIKAYGSNIIGLVEVPENFNIIPMYDEYVLSQFRNAKVVGLLGYRDSFDQLASDSVEYLWTPPHNDVTKNPFGCILQNTKGDIVSAEAIIGDSSDRKRRGGALAALPTILDVRRSMPAPEDVIEATRLMVDCFRIDEVTSGDTEVPRYYINCGTEIVVDCQIYYMAYTDYERNLQYVQYKFIGDPEADIGVLRQFEHSPTVIICGNAETIGAPANGLRVVGNFYNATRIDSDQLARMHEVALLSLLYVPGIAKINAL